MKCKNHHFLFHTVNLLVFVFDAFIIQAGFSSFHVHDFTFGSFHYFFCSRYSFGDIPMQARNVREKECED